MLTALSGTLHAVATAVGYVVLSLLTLSLIATLLLKRRANDVSPEARQMAKAADPNNGATQDLTAIVADDILSHVRELRDDEAVQPDPEPICTFDWSLSTARQEHIEHVIQTLRRAGYHVQPFPEADYINDKHTWGVERGGVWLSEPDWEIVRYDDESGRRVASERIDLPLPQEWEPVAAADGG